uniref:Uncharacterized protein n=1 Tax=Scleropages formosus TaxID=113540 RepID=A0A8C9R6L0_SCLFO
MIQSSQPISLKLTWSCFLLQRGLGFLGMNRYSALRSTGRPLSTASSSKQSWAAFLKLLNSFQMSNTSHFGASCSSITRVWSKVAFCLPAAQVKSFRLNTLPVERTLRGSACLLRRMRSSAPSKPSFSRELIKIRQLLMANTYNVDIIDECVLKTKA